MEVLIEGVSAHPTEVIIREGLFDYTATLQFQLPYCAAFEECVLRITDDLPFVPVSVQQASNSTFQYLCYPKGYVDFLNGVTPPVNVTGELPALLDRFAVCRYSVVSPSQPQHWVLASMGGKALMDKLSRQVRYVNGGCPTAHFDIGGVLICQDVLERCTGEATSVISGVLTGGMSSMTAMNQAHGRIRFHYFDEATYSSKEDVYTEHGGAANLYKFVVADDRKSQVEAELQAQFWRRYVATAVTEFENIMAPMVVPGQKVQLLGKEQTYVCISVRTEESTAGAKVSGTFMPCITPQQTLG